MNTEYEAKFTDIDKDNIRSRLQQQGAALIKPETLQKRVVFLLPRGHEIEGGSEEAVRELGLKLGFDWSQAVFGSTHLLTSRKYGIPEDALNNEIPRIVFGESNPYLGWQNPRVAQ